MAGVGAALGAVLLLAGLRDEPLFAARTLLHRSAVDHGHVYRSDTEASLEGSLETYGRRDGTR